MRARYGLLAALLCLVGTGCNDWEVVEAGPKLASIRTYSEDDSALLAIHCISGRYLVVLSQRELLSVWDDYRVRSQFRGIDETHYWRLGGSRILRMLPNPQYVEELKKSSLVHLTVLPTRNISGGEYQFRARGLSRAIKKVQCG
jgi:hypothetical protein